MDTLRQDLIYSSRSLARVPAFSAIVVLTLALGVGANSAVFSVLNAVLFRPLPFPGAGRVVNLAWDGGGHLQELSSGKFRYWHDHARSFDAVTTWRASRQQVDIGGEITSARTLRVTHEFLQALGYTPALGRTFVAAEDVPGGPDVAIVSHAIWQARLAGAADAAGRTIAVNGAPVAVVGVLPESFAFPYEDEPIDLIVPLRLTTDPKDIAEDWPTIARLREGVSREQAHADVVSLNAVFRSEYPHQVSENDRGMRVATFSELHVDGGVQRALWILLGAVAIVLLIACANVANLFLARASERRREIAVRAALGATNSRITRLLLTECALVAVGAGALGLVFGAWVAGVLVALTPVQVPRMTAVVIDWRVMVFTSLASLVTLLMFGTAAAWPAARAQLSDALKHGMRGSSARNRFRQGLLVAQSALSMVLLVGAGLLLATLLGLSRVDPGFDPEGLVVVRLPSKPAGYGTSEAISEFARRVVHFFDGSPAIASIASASSLPFERGVNTPITLASRPDVAGTVEWRAVSPDYFRTLGIALLAGRAFERTDAATGERVAIVNESFARRFFPGDSAIGQRLHVGRFKSEPIDPARASPMVEIVGIVADIREVSLRTEPRRTMYVPQEQAPTVLSNVLGTLPVFIARVGASGGHVEPLLAQGISAADARIPRPQVFPLHDAMARTLARERFGATLLSVLGALALALTALGIHGVLMYSVQQRRREIGIRMALGADSAQVMRLLIVQALAPVLVGLVLGVAGAIGLSERVAGFLWGVSPTDPGTFAAVAAVLLGVALIATWIPSREAANLEPASAINCE
jgi:predicted permease